MSEVEAYVIYQTLIFSKLVKENVSTSQNRSMNQFGRVKAAAILSAKISNARREFRCFEPNPLPE